jgi:hypothetical protein
MSRADNCELAISLARAEILRVEGLLEVLRGSRTRLRILAPLGNSGCFVHDWPTESLARRLATQLRHRHAGWINVCGDCIVRAHEEAEPLAAAGGQP